MSILELLLLVAIALPQGIQEPEHLEDLIVTATRTEKPAFEIPAFVSLIDAEQMRTRRPARTVPEALMETPGVMVQKTGHGQGSPYIRGLTGFRTLFLIDGIRLNNSVFRDGPNQYWATVDPLSLDRLEVVKGPSSVLYGSDAIAGTVNAITRGPATYGAGFNWERRLTYRYSSAERAHGGRAEISGSLDQDLGFLIGGALKNFGDVRGGRSVGLQRKTGYDELDGDLKFEYFPDDESRLTFAYQSVYIDDAWRTHKTIYGESWEGTTVGSEKKRVLDQKRKLAYVKYDREIAGGILDTFSTTFSYQLQQEERFRIKSSDAQERQGFDVGTIGISAQLASPSEIGRFTYGAEYYRDSVDSFNRTFNADGSFNSTEIQGPVADDSTYDLLGVYLQDEIEVADQCDLILGSRYTYAAADANDMEDPYTGNMTSLSENWDTVTASARLLVGLDAENHWNLFTGVSQGFRAPNLSDLTRLDSARTGEFETPSPDLDPEEYVSYELGLKSRYENWSSQFAYYYTDIRNMIMRTPTGNVIDDNLGVIPDPNDGTQRDIEVIKKNSGDGYIHGIELNASYRFLPRFTAFTAFSWLYGEVETYPTASSRKKTDTIDRLMPPMGNAGVRWNHESDMCWLEGICAFADKADKLSQRDASDTQRIPPGGTPGYVVFHLRSGFKLLETLTLSAAIENIFNEDYRIHGSGQNEPGRGLLVGLDWRF